MYLLTVDFKALAAVSEVMSHDSVLDLDKGPSMSSGPDDDRDSPLDTRPATPRRARLPSRKLLEGAILGNDKEILAISSQLELDAQVLEAEKAQTATSPLKRSSARTRLERLGPVLSVPERSIPHFASLS